MSIENAQKTVTVIVDRRVLAELLKLADLYYSFDVTGKDIERGLAMDRLRREVEAGERTTLFGADWPGSGGAG